MTARFADTLKALKEGASGMTVEQAVKNIEAWEDHVAGLEVSGAKTLHTDLGALKRALQSDPISGPTVMKLMTKLAGDTVRIAGRTEGKRGEQVAELGAGLEAAVKAEG